MLVPRCNLRSRVLFYLSKGDSREFGGVPGITSVIEILGRDISKVSEKASVSAQLFRELHTRSNDVHKTLDVPILLGLHQRLQT